MENGVTMDMQGLKPRPVRYLVFQTMMQRSRCRSSLHQSGVRYESRMYTLLQRGHDAAGEEGRHDPHVAWYTRVLSKGAV